MLYKLPPCSLKLHCNSGEGNYVRNCLIILFIYIPVTPPVILYTVYITSSFFGGPYLILAFWKRKRQNLKYLLAFLFKSAHISGLVTSVSFPFSGSGRILFCFCFCFVFFVKRFSWWRPSDVSIIDRSPNVKKQNKHKHFSPLRQNPGLGSYLLVRLGGPRRWSEEAGKVRAAAPVISPSVGLEK